MFGEPPGVADYWPGALAFPAWVEPKADGFRFPVFGRLRPDKKGRAVA